MLNLVGDVKEYFCRLYSHIIDRTKSCTKYCIICDKPLDYVGLKPAVCDNPLCTFSYVPFQCSCGFGALTVL